MFFTVHFSCLMREFSLNALMHALIQDTDSSENLKSRRRKPSTGLRSSQAEKARKLVTTQTNLRAKFYSRVSRTNMLLCLAYVIQ